MDRDELCQRELDADRVVEQHVHHEHFIDDERGKHRAFDDPRELRAFVLKSAIDCKSWWESKAESTTEAADNVLTTARRFEAYITGDTNG